MTTDANSIENVNMKLEKKKRNTVMESVSINTSTMKPFWIPHNIPIPSNLE